MRNILRQYVTFTLKKEGIIIKGFLLHLVRSVLVSDLKMHTGQNRDIQLKIVLTWSLFSISESEEEKIF